MCREPVSMSHVLERAAITTHCHHVGAAHLCVTHVIRARVPVIAVIVCAAMHVLQSLPPVIVCPQPIFMSHVHRAHIPIVAVCHCAHGRVHLL